MTLLSANQNAYIFRANDNKKYTIKKMNLLRNLQKEREEIIKIRQLIIIILLQGCSHLVVIF